MAIREESSERLVQPLTLEPGVLTASTHRLHEEGSHYTHFI